MCCMGFTAAGTWQKLNKIQMAYAVWRITAHMSGNLKPFPPIGQQQQTSSELERYRSREGNFAKRDGLYICEEWRASTPRQRHHFPIWKDRHRRMNKPFSLLCRLMRGSGDESSHQWRGKVAFNSPNRSIQKKWNATIALLYTQVADAIKGLKCGWLYRTHPTWSPTITCWFTAGNRQERLNMLMLRDFVIQLVQSYWSKGGFLLASFQLASLYAQFVCDAAESPKRTILVRIRI